MFIRLISEAYTPGFPSGSAVKESACNAGDAAGGAADSIPGSGRSPGEGNGNPLQYSCLENPMDIGAWRAIQSLGEKELDMPERLNNSSNDPMNISIF